MHDLLKITEAAKLLGVSTKTLRRWDQMGKLSPKRTSGGARRYSLDDLNKIDPSLGVVQKPKFKPPPDVVFAPPAPKEKWIDPGPVEVSEPVSFIVAPKDTIYKKFFASVAVVAAIAVISFGAALSALGLFGKTPVSSEVIKRGVLAAVAPGKPYFEVNSDAYFNGDLNVSGITITGNGTMNVNGTPITLNQDISKTSNPTFNSLTLTSNNNQLGLSSGNKITIPDANGTLVLTNNTQTLTNKTIDGGSNTLTNIPNSSLSNSKVTITAGTNLSGGGDVNLGSSVTINLKGDLSISTLTTSGNASVSSLFVAGTATIAGSLLPDVTLTRDIGSTTKYWSTIYATNLITGSSGTSGYWTRTGTTLSPINANDNVTITGVGYTGLKLPTGAVLNYVLTTDGTGQASWTNPTASGSFGAWTLTGTTVYPNLTNYNVVLGSTNVLDATATFRVLGNSGTTPIASISGATSKAALIVDQSGSGDIFTASVAGLPKFVITNSGNVGVGTTSPSYSLDVTGTLRTTSTAILGSIYVGPNSDMSIQRNNPTEYGDYPSQYQEVLGAFGGGLQLKGLDVTLDAYRSTGGNIKFWTAPNGGATTERMRINSNGNVGIGTTAPGSLLSVLGSTYPCCGMPNNVSTVSINQTTTAGISNLISLTNGDSNDGSEARILFNTYGGLGGLGFQKWGIIRFYGGASATEFMRIDNTGRVGIGATAPLATLDTRGNSGTIPVASISGTTVFPSLVVDQSGSGAIFTASVAGLPKFIIDNGGNVGIGTTNPLYKLDVAGTIAVNSTVTLGTSGLLGNTGTSFCVSANNCNFTNSSSIVLYGSNAGVAPNEGDVIITTGQYAPYSMFGKFRIKSGLTEVFTVDQNGDVGIGTTSPLARLDMSGSLNFSALAVPGALTAGTPTAGGLCTPGTHSYVVTFTTVGAGETTSGTASNIITCVLTSGQTVPLSAIPTGPAGTISRKIYRTVAGNTGNYLLLTTIADNTTTTFSDTVADASLGAAAPVSNTTAVANIQTGGTTRMIIDSNGNVGIGTTSPRGNLDIQNGINPTNIYFGTDDALNNYNYIYGGLANSSGYGRPYLSFRSASNGNTVTLGTSSTGGSGGYLQFGSNIANSVLDGYYPWIIRTDQGNSYIAFQTSGANERMRIDGSGNVGIGTTTPLATLDVRGNSGTTPVASISGSTAFPSLVVDQRGSGAIFTASVAGLPKFIIDNGGNVGIGTTAPGAKLESLATTEQLRLSYDSTTPIDFSVGSTGDLTINQSKLASIGSIRFKVSGSNNPSAEVVTIQGTGGAAGRLGIMNTAPAYTLDVNGTVRIGPAAGVPNLLLDNSSLYTLQANGNGNARNLSNISFGWQVNTQGAEQGSIIFKAATPNDINSTNLSEVMRIIGASTTNGGGNVGIGTTAPVAKLDVSGSLNFSAFAVPGALTAGTPTAGGLCTPGTHSYAVTFTSIGGGETTAGTASNIITCVLTSGQTVPLSAIPTGPAGTISRKIYRTVAGNTGNYLLLTTIADNTTTTFSDTVADASLGAAAPVSNTTAVANIQTGGTNRMTIDSTGNVGIGTTTPGTKLDVFGDVRLLLPAQGFIAGDANGSGPRGLNLYNYTANLFNTNGALNFSTSATGVYASTPIRMTLDGGGNVGIGVTAPLATLDVRGNSGTTPVASISGTSVFPSLVVDQRGSGAIFTASVAGLPKFIIDNGGNVGIGTTAPGALLDLAGNATSSGNLTFRSASTIATTAKQTLTLGDANTGNIALTGNTVLGGQTYTWPGSQTANYVLQTNGSGVLSWAAQGSVWNQTGGLLYPTNSTWDLAIGGTSTASAKFAFINVNTGTPTATISGNIVLDSAGIIQTTKNQTLTLGGNSTGNIVLQPNNGVGTLSVAGNNIVLGAGDGGTPATTTVRGAAAGGSNIAGANLIFDASNGTGSQGSGALIFRTAAPLPSTAITFDAAAHSSGSSVTSLTWSHVVGSGGSRILIVSLQIFGSDVVTGITYGGAALTRIANLSSGADQNQIWYLKNPTTGTANVVISLSSSVSAIAAGSVSYSGVDQTASTFGTAATFTSTFTNNPSVTVSSAANELVIDSLLTESAITYSPGAGQTQRWVDSATALHDGGSDKAGAASVVMSWSWASQVAATLIGIPMRPAGASTADSLAERLRIDQNGYVGIGATSPLATFDVRGNLGTIPVASISGTTALPSLVVDQRGSGAIFTASVAGLPKFIVDNGGNVGIGTTAPGQALDVTGTIRQSGCKTAGTLSANTSGDIICTSDARLKNILGSYTGGLGVLSQISPQLFTYKPTATDPVETFVHAGFIAQNVMAVIPQASALQDNGYYSLDTTAILAAAVNSINEQQTEIATISATTANLQTDISNLLTIVPQIRSDIQNLKTEMASVSGRLANVENKIASPSATPALADLSNWSNLNISTISAEFANFSDSLKVIGKTQLADTTIGGSLSVGLLHFDDLKAEISSLTGLVTINSSLNVMGDATVSGKLKVGKGIVIPDSVTGEDYCISVASGAAVVKKGACQ